MDTLGGLLEARLERPSWDEYFVATAVLIAARSACGRLRSLARWRMSRTSRASTARRPSRGRHPGGKYHFDDANDPLVSDLFGEAGIPLTRF